MKIIRLVAHRNVILSLHGNLRRICLCANRGFFVKMSEAIYTKVSLFYKT